jgi:hypothetical protein
MPLKLRPSGLGSGIGGSVVRRRSLDHLPAGERVNDPIGGLTVIDLDRSQSFGFGLPRLRGMGQSPGRQRQPLVVEPHAGTVGGKVPQQARLSPSAP